jgi:predicted nucleic acid-binding protein
VDPGRRRRGWELFRKYRDLPVGLVDCTSFAIMRELALEVVFGFDSDFLAAGFRPYDGRVESIDG